MGRTKRDATEASDRVVVVPGLERSPATPGLLRRRRDPAPIRSAEPAPMPSRPGGAIKCDATGRVGEAPWFGVGLKLRLRGLACDLRCDLGCDLALRADSAACSPAPVPRPRTARANCRTAPVECLAPRNTRADSSRYATRPHDAPAERRAIPRTPLAFARRRPLLTSKSADENKLEHRLSRQMCEKWMLANASLIFLKNSLLPRKNSLLPGLKFPVIFRAAEIREYHLIQ